MASDVVELPLLRD